MTLLQVWPVMVMGLLAGSCAPLPPPPLPAHPRARVAVPACVMRGLRLAWWWFSVAAASLTAAALFPTAHAVDACAQDVRSAITGCCICVDDDKLICICICHSLCQVRVIAMSDRTVLHPRLTAAAASAPVAPEPADAADDSGNSSSASGCGPPMKQLAPKKERLQSKKLRKGEHRDDGVCGKGGGGKR